MKTSSNSVREAFPISMLLDNPSFGCASQVQYSGCVRRPLHWALSLTGHRNNLSFIEDAVMPKGCSPYVTRRVIGLLLRWIHSDQSVLNLRATRTRGASTTFIRLFGNIEKLASVSCDSSGARKKRERPFLPVGTAAPLNSITCTEPLRTKQEIAKDRVNTTSEVRAKKRKSAQTK